MKTILFFAFALVAFGQQPPQRQQIPLVSAVPQPAQTVTIQLTADVATALESMRLNIHAQIDPVTGIIGPLYPNIQVMLNELMKRRGGIFEQALNLAPPASIKARQT